MKNILIVCKGNICRSPIAHGLLDKKAKENNLSLFIDSAGTGHWHVGKLPDRRSIEVAHQNGLDITYQRARQFQKEDFERFDVIYVMDHQNKKKLIEMTDCPIHLSKMELIMDVSSDSENDIVPDPFHDGKENFHQVYRVLDHVTDQIISKELEVC